MRIGDKLKAARNAASIEVSQISQELQERGIKASKQTIYSWENNNSQPTPDALLYMCYRYGITDILSYFGYRYGDNLMPSQSELFLLQKYRRLPDTGKQAVENMMDAMLAAQPEPDKVVPMAPENNAEEAQETSGRMMPIAVAAFGDDGSEPRIRMVPEEALKRAAEKSKKLAAEKAEAERKREEAAARMRAYYADQDKKKKKRQ